MVVQQPDFNFTKEEIKDLINIKSELQRLQRRMRPTTSVIRHLMDDPNVSDFPHGHVLFMAVPLLPYPWPAWRVCGRCSLHQKDHGIVHGASHLQLVSLKHLSLPRVLCVSAGQGHQGVPG